MERADLSSAREPFRQRRPAVDQALVCELEHRRTCAARDDEPPAHECIEGGARDQIVLDTERRRITPLAGAIRRHETKQQAARREPLRGQQ